MKHEQIGDCTLYHGDSRELEPAIHYDSIASDPPFGMDFQSNHREIQHIKIANDKTEDLLKWTCDLEADHSMYIFCRWDNLAAIPKPKSLITWIKNNHSMGDLEHEHGRQTEVIAFYNGANHSWPTKRPNDVIKADRTGNIFHPTEKPVELMKVIVGWTAGIVFDPFMGSGTTGVACAQLNRKFIGCELEQKYFDIACKRIENAYKQPDMFVHG